MKIRILAYAVCLLFCGLFVSLEGSAQDTRSSGNSIPFRSPGSDSIKIVIILNANTEHFQQVDSVTSVTTLVGNVRIKQGNTLIECDSMVMAPKDNYIESFGHVHINDNDSTNIYSDYMKYLVDKRTIHFLKAVKLTDGKGVLTTEDMEYDLNQKVGVYNNGGRIVNKGSVLTSQHATYYEATKDVYFQKDVLLRDPQYDLSADSLLYNTETQISTFITETYILFKDSTHRSVRTSSGYYDLKNRKAFFGKRPVIVDGSQNITGDSVNIDDSTGINTAVGHAVYKDTTQGIVLRADYMITNKKKSTFLATRNPLMILKQDKDSIYITADTLFSARLVDAQAEEQLLAVRDSLHKIYVDSLDKASHDSLHLRALGDTLHTQDTLLAVKDPNAIQVRDRSDSLRPGVADSLGNLALDSLHIRQAADNASDKRKALPGLTGTETDTTHIEHIEKDSAGRAKDSILLQKKITDSIQRSKLTPKQRERLEHKEARAQVEMAKAKVKAHVDSLRDQASDRRDSVRAKSKVLRDSAKAEVRAAKARVRSYADSVRRHAYNEKLKAIAFADSVKTKLTTDSLARVRKDSLAVLGLTDSILQSRVDSVRRRAKDSSDRVRHLGKYAVSVAVVPIDSSLRYIKGYHHVRIFSDSLQAVSDSMYYSGKDSIFRLFKEPIAWGSGDYQVTGDTMYVYTKNKKANRMYVFENALALNKIGKNFYNQLKGTTINCYFVNGEVDYMRSKGNAESIYYIKDDFQAYTGVNRAHADIIDMIFTSKAPDSTGKVNGRELNRVVLRSDAEGSMIPITKVVFDDMRLRGFKWQEAKRPKSKEELYAGKVVKKVTLDENGNPGDTDQPDEKKKDEKTGKPDGTDATKKTEKTEKPAVQKPAADKKTKP